MFTFWFSVLRRLRLRRSSRDTARIQGAGERREGGMFRPEGGVGSGIPRAI